MTNHTSALVSEIVNRKEGVMYKYPARILPVFASIIVLWLALAACTAAPEFAIKDKNQAQGAKSIATFDVNNSQGTGPLVQNYPVSKSYYRWVDIKLASNSQLDEFTVSDKIYGRYKVAKDDTKVCVIPVEIPAKQNYEYDLEWTEVLRQGVIEAGANGGGTQLGTYQILIDMSCQVVAQRTAGQNPTTTPTVIQ